MPGKAPRPRARPPVQRMFEFMGPVAGWRKGGGRFVWHLGSRDLVEVISKKPVTKGVFFSRVLEDGGEVASGELLTWTRREIRRMWAPLRRVLRGRPFFEANWRLHGAVRRLDTEYLPEGHRPRFMRKGIVGTIVVPRMEKWVQARANEAGKTVVLIARIAPDNAASMGLARKAGFRRIPGVFESETFQFPFAFWYKPFRPQ